MIANCIAGDGVESDHPVTAGFSYCLLAFAMKAFVAHHKLCAFSIPQDWLYLPKGFLKKKGSPFEREPISTRTVSRRYRLGKVNAKVAPFPGSLSTQIRPPCAFTISRQIASPKPMPRFSGGRDSSPR